MDYEINIFIQVYSYMMAIIILYAGFVEDLGIVVINNLST